MKNYERYKNITAEDYDKKTIMSYLCKIPSDKKILPLICQIKNKKILDAGVGTGFYAKILLEKNEVVGVDRNIHLCKLPIKLYEGDVTRLSQIFHYEKFDIVFSTWMTEYLSEPQLVSFLTEAGRVLNKNGLLITTFISNYGLGYGYVKLAKIIKKIDKYFYGVKQIQRLVETAGYDNIEIINLNSYLKIPWACLVTAKRKIT